MGNTGKNRLVVCSAMGPNPSFQPTCYGWLRQPTQAAELKR
jgi:hypothetical protein